MLRVIRLKELIHRIQDCVPGHGRDVSDNNLREGKKTILEFINTEETLLSMFKHEAPTYSELLSTPTLCS